VELVVGNHQHQHDSDQPSQSLQTFGLPISVAMAGYRSLGIARKAPWESQEMKKMRYFGRKISPS
jgi:hypothetical protein